MGSHLTVREAWPEIADFDDHVMTVVLAGGTLQYRVQELISQRSGALEPVWLNLDYSPVLGHDLRNPLQAINVTAELLERKLSLPAHAELATQIRTYSQRMGCLIDDALDFGRARLGAGIGVELCIVDDVNRGLATVVQEVQVNQPECTILTNISVTHSVRRDLARLEQVTANLLANALTHGQPLSPVTFSATADENDLLLEMWNTGEPIPPDSVDKIFEPRWRPKTPGSRNGLGLGLHICSSIVKAHEGTLAVVSTRDTGTRFTVRVPLRGTITRTGGVPLRHSHAALG